MARLSNFVSRHDQQPDEPDESLQCRPARREEIDDALRLILANANGPASDEQVLEFLSYAVQRGVDVSATWIATREAGSLDWALLPAVSPGRTMLILTPAYPLHRTPASSIRTLIDELCFHYAMRDVQLAQLLLDPKRSAVHAIYEEAGFAELAELVYLHRAMRSAIDFAEAAPPGLQLLTYSDHTHALFLEAVAQSYQQSLDCPGLNGMRDIEDVLTGHKAAGVFDPKLWFVLLEDRQPRTSPKGVLLLNKSPHSDALELVYLGLQQEARGQGIGDWLMRLALANVGRAQRSALTLAVDARNQPALNLYFRHGLRRVGSRLAMLRDLRRRQLDSPVDTGPRSSISPLA